MEELPRSSFESTDSDTESGSEKKKKDSSNVRRIGALGTYAKMTPETTPAPVDRTEARESFFKDKEDTEKKPEIDSTTEEPEAVEANTEATETAAKTEALQEELTKRIEIHQEVIDSTPEDSPEHVQASAAKALDESVKEKAANPDVEADPVIEAEFARQLAETELPEESSPDNEVENNISVSSTKENDDSDVEDNIPATNSATGTPSATTPPTQASNGAGLPPVPPTPPTRPAPVLPPLPPIGGINTFTQPNAAPNTVPAISPNILQDSQNERTKRRVNPAASALLGYAIGRRGGRKRTERRLEPKIADLSQELDITKKHLEARELDMQKVARNTLREQQAEKYARQPEQVEQTKKKPVSEILRQTVMAPEKIHSAITPSEVQPPLTEVPKVPKIETVPRSQVVPEAAIKRTEQLSTPALLKAAESLIIEGVSVRRMYETNKIDRNGLVAIVQEGLRGGNIVHAFEKVELGPEAQAGRAREFRHDDPSFSAIPADDPVLPDLKPSPLPNNPDTGSLQPINIPSQKNDPGVIATAQPEINTRTEKKALLNPKTAEFKFAAIAAIAIAALIVWAIF